LLAGLVELGLEGVVDGLKGEHGGDTSEVEAVFEELADLAEAGQVVVAVATGATLAARRADQAAGFVQAEVLGRAADQFGGHGDPVHAPRGIWQPAATRWGHHKNFPPTLA
jgi:hypothetical protein